MRVMLDVTDPVGRMHTMTKREGKSETIDLKALLTGDEDYLRAMVEAIVQATLEAEMTEALGAAKGERSAGDRLHLARRHPLHVHLRQRPHQRLLRALVALEQRRREPTLPVLRHPQLQRPHPGDQRPAVVAAAIAEPTRAALPLRR